MDLLAIWPMLLTSEPQSPGPGRPKNWSAGGDEAAQEKAALDEAPTWGGGRFWFGVGGGVPVVVRRFLAA